jgi:hypothetical protein
MKMMIDEPSVDAADGGTTADNAEPDVIATAVPAIVTAAMITLGASAIGLPRTPNPNPAARLSRLETSATRTAGSQNTRRRYLSRRDSVLGRVRCPG